MTNKKKIIKAPTPTKKVAEARIMEVASMLLAAKSRAEIVNYCVNNYRLQPKSVTHLVTKAYQFISETHAVDRQGLVDVHISLYYELHAMAKSLGDASGAAKALASIEKLLKITNDALVQQNTLNINMKDMSLGELKELLKIT